MNIYQRLKLAFQLSGQIKQQGISGEQVQRAIFQYLRGHAPIPIEDSPDGYISDAFSFNPDVYSVVSHILQAISSVPYVVYEVKDEKKAKEYVRLKHQQRNRSSESFVFKAKKLREKALEEVDEKDDLVKLLDKPNPLQAWPEFLENLLGFQLVTGNTYGHGIELTDRRFGELWVLPPQLTRIHADHKVEALIKGYSLEALNFHNDIIPSHNVIHLKYWNPDFSITGNHLYGMAPLKAGRRVIRASNDGDGAMAKAFSNMGASGMIYPDDPDLQDGISPEARQDIENFFKQKAKGIENYKSVLVPSAKLGWQSFGMSPVDLELIAADRMTMRKICNLFRFPSILLNDPDTRTHANLKEARKQLWLDVCIPLLERTFTEINRWLTKPYKDYDGKLYPPRYGENYFIDYDVSGIEALSEDMKDKSAWLRNMWEIPPNRKLEEMNFNVIDDPLFDEPWVPMNVIPYSQMSAPDLSLSNEDINVLIKEYSKNGHEIS